MKRLCYMLFICLMMVSPISCYAKTEETIETNGVKIETVILESCVDGDTAKFRTESDEVIKARFLAIDTPETVHPTKGEEPFGKDASDYTCTTLTNAKEITLEYDNNSDEEDNYGRKLVWVFVDGVLLQNSLVSQGYAKVAYLYGDYKYTSLLQDSEVIAQDNNLGIWSIVEEESTTTEAANDENDTEESFISKLFDDLLGMIFDFVNDLLESLLKMIEEML